MPSRPPASPPATVWILQQRFTGAMAMVYNAYKARLGHDHVQHEYRLVTAHLDPAGLRELATREGVRIARKLFSNRGNNSEVHLNEAELAGALGAAFELGYELGRELGNDQAKEGERGAPE